MKLSLSSAEVSFFVWVGKWEEVKRKCTEREEKGNESTQVVHVPSLPLISPVFFSFPLH